MNFDEVNAYFSSVKADLSELIRILKSSSQLDRELNSFHYAKHNILHDLSFAKRVTIKTQTIAKHAIETLRTHASDVGFDIQTDVMWARWRQLDPREGYYYTVRLEIIEYVKDMSYSDKLKLLENKMITMKKASQYFHHQMSLVGLVVKYALTDPYNTNNIRLLEILNKKLVRRLNFGANSIIPTFADYLTAFEQEVQAEGISWNRN